MNSTDGWKTALIFSACSMARTCSKFFSFTRSVSYSSRPKDWISWIPDRLSWSLPFSSPIFFWDLRKNGRTFLEKRIPEAKISGIGAQVISASFQLMVSSTASTPAKVTPLVIVSGIMWAYSSSKSRVSFTTRVIVFVRRSPTRYQAALWAR